MSFKARCSIVGIILTFGHRVSVQHNIVATKGGISGVIYIYIYIYIPPHAADLDEQLQPKIWGCPIIFHVICTPGTWIFDRLMLLASICLQYWSELMVKVPKRNTNDTFLFAGEGSYFFENPKMLKIQCRSRDLAFKWGGRPI